MDLIPNGVWPTMVTPYTSDNHIDYRSVEQIIQFYQQRGVAGIFAVCQSSEMFFLSLEERVELARFISHNCPPGIGLVVSGHVSDDPETQLREADAIMGDGILAYVVVPNRFAARNEGDDILIERMKYFMEHLPGVPLGIYECPYPYKRLVTPAVLEWCISTGRFYFLKDTCCDMAAITQKLNISKNSGLKIYNANSATVLDSLKAGAAGFSGIMGNMQPELYVWLYSNYSTQIEKAQKLQHFLTLSALVEAFGYPCCAKYYMRLEGLDIGLHSRSVNPEAFGGQDRLNMRHLHELTMTAKSLLKINDEKEFIS